MGGGVDGRFEADEGSFSRQEEQTPLEPDQFSVANAWVASSNSTTGRPDEFFDRTGCAATRGNSVTRSERRRVKANVLRENPQRNSDNDCQKAVLGYSKPAGSRAEGHRRQDARGDRPHPGICV